MKTWFSEVRPYYQYSRWRKSKNFFTSASCFVVVINTRWVSVSELLYPRKGSFSRYWNVCTLYWLSIPDLQIWNPPNTKNFGVLCPSDFHISDIPTCTLPKDKKIQDHLLGRNIVYKKYSIVSSFLTSHQKQVFLVFPFLCWEQEFGIWKPGFKLKCLYSMDLLGWADDICLTICLT